MIINKSHVFIGSFISLIFCYGVNPPESFSQSIQLDGSTPTRINLSISGSCIPQCLISNGTTRGQNLFHSFRSFNVASNSRVLFLGGNAKNIFSRVTGISPSTINGTIGVYSGNANLFLINPNGIIFGDNANLSLNGSFLATTASGIRFGNQGSFTSTASPVPEITIHPSALLFGHTTQPISLANASLSVLSNQNFYLIGGPILINSSEISAVDGHIGLTGLAQEGEIDINKLDNGQLSFVIPDRLRRANLLINGSSINVTGNGTGNIDFLFKDIDISNSLILAGFEPLVVPDLSKTGNISLSANDSITISGSLVVNRIRAGAVGRGGDVNVTAKNIFLTNFTELSATTFGIGPAGDVKVSAQETFSLDQSNVFSNVEARFDSQSGNYEFRAEGNGGLISIKADILTLDNDSEITAITRGTGNSGQVQIKANKITLKNTNGEDITGIFTNIEQGGVGNGGEINIMAESLDVSDGSQITASVRGARGGLPGGIGKGGNISIDTSRYISLSGFSRISGFASGVLALTEEGANGQGGNINIQTPKLSVIFGADITTQTRNKQDGGNININVHEIEVLGGSQITSSTFDAGNAGNIEINATKNITLAGQDPPFSRRRRLQLIESFQTNEGINANVISSQLAAFRDLGPGSGIYANTTLESSGNAGNIIIDPPSIFISDGARIAVNSQGSGLGGNIQILAGDLTLDRGSITAATASNKGGSISIQLEDFLFLRNQSEISASAGELTQSNSTQPITGGNITIIAKNIVAEPNSNSDIFANSFGGEGGVINLTATKNLFGFDLENNDLNFRSLNTRNNTTNDITARSSVSPDLNGQVFITTGEVDPGDNLSEQPETVVPPQEIAKGCRPGQTLGNSTFTHVGRGGLPPSPHQTQTPTTVWQDLRSHNLQPASISSTDQSPSSLIHTPPSSITEAKGWTKDTQGRIYLTANVPQPAQSPQPIATC